MAKFDLVIGPGNVIYVYLIVYGSSSSFLPLSSLLLLPSLVRADIHHPDTSKREATHDQRMQKKEEKEEGEEEEIYLDAICHRAAVTTDTLKLQVEKRSEFLFLILII